MTADDAMNLPWDQRQRFRFIEAHAISRGVVRMADVRDRFGVSTGKAQKDFAVYARLAPGNLRQDRETGEYHAEDAFAPQFLRGNAADYLQVLRDHELDRDDATPLAAGRPVVVETLDLPLREFDVRVLARINTAIRARRWLGIEYQSMNHPEPRRIEIAPHALACAGRWHARAWSALHEGYRDFLLSRICAVPELLGVCARDPQLDWDWRNEIVVRIAPHPQLSAAQRGVVERDYGMLHGMRELRVRAALVPYCLRLLGVGRGDRERAPGEQQIVLHNAGDLDALNRL